MYLRKYPINRRSLINDFANRSVADVVGRDFTVNQPSVNIVEEADQHLIHLAAPGLTKEDFIIKIDKDHLVISSEKEQNETGKFTRKEFNYSSFKRSFYLPKEINKDGISAEYNNGILNVTLLKKEEAKEKDPVTIEIR